MQEPSHSRTARETEMPHNRILRHFLTYQLRLLGTARHNVENSRRTARALEEFRHRKGAQWCFGRGFTHHGISRRDRGADFTGHHCDRRVPGRNCCDDALRLADREDPILASRGRDGLAVLSFNSPLEPVDEIGAVFHCHEGFCKGLAEFERADCSQVVFCLSDEVGPAAH